MNKKAFTLIEMIVVVLLLGVVLTIVVPNVTKLIGRESDTEYSTQIKLTKIAMDTFFIRYQGTIKTVTNSCIMVDYNTLKSEKLIEENNIKCNGKIIARPKNNNSFSYEYYLNCTDKNNKVKSSYNTSNLPTNCYNMVN